MKRNLLLFAFMTLLVGSAAAQTFSVQDTAVYIDFQVPMGTNPEGHTVVTNLTGANINMRWVRTVNNVNSPWLDYVCIFPTCWGPFDDTKDFVLADTTTDADMFLTVVHQNTMGTGEVHVVLTDTNNPNYSQTVIFYINATVGIEAEMEKSLSIYPNPVQSDLVVSWAHEGFRAANVEIMDMNGKVMMQTDMASGLGKRTLDTGSFATGMYLLKITDRDGHRFIRKFVKE